jgi:hypothetical protein
LASSRLIGAAAVLACLIACITLATMLSQGHSQGRQAPRQGTLRVGDPAPDFALQTLDETAEVTLSSYRGECPVALIFGSYT